MPTQEQQDWLGNALGVTGFASADGDGVAETAGDPAQQPAKPMGDLVLHVVDKRNFKGIKGAHIHIDQKGVSSSKSIDLDTDGNGDAPGIRVEAGDYTITVDAHCYDSHTFTIHVDEGSNLQTLPMTWNCDVSSTDVSDGNALAAADGDADATANADG
jgi:hypothetical protein